MTHLKLLIIQAFAPGSPEREALRAELAAVESTCKDIPIIIGGEEIRNENVQYQVSPYNHQQKIAKYYWADEALLKKAADAAVAAQVTWILFLTSFHAERGQNCDYDNLF